MFVPPSVEEPSPVLCSPRSNGTSTVDDVSGLVTWTTHGHACAGVPTTNLRVNEPSSRVRVDVYPPPRQSSPPRFARLPQSIASTVIRAGQPRPVTFNSAPGSAAFGDNDADGSTVRVEVGRDIGRPD